MAVMLDGTSRRFQWQKTTELAPAVPNMEVVGKGDYFRFGMRDSLAIEASFLQVWDAVTGAKLYTFEGHKAPVYSVCSHFKENIQFIFSTATDGKIKAWLYDNMGSRVDYDAPGHSSTTMAHSADGTSERAVKRTYNALGKRSVEVVRFDTTKNRFLAAGDEFMVKFWDMDNVNLLTTTDADGGLPPPMMSMFGGANNTYVGVGSSIMDRVPLMPSMMTMNGENRSLIDVKPRIGDEGSRNWKLIEITEPSQCRSLRLPDTTSFTMHVSRLIYTNSGLAILALAANAVHKLWKWQRTDNNSTGKKMTTFMAPPPAATFLAFHPQDNNIIAIGMEDSFIQIYNVRVDEVKTKLKGHHKRITGLAFSNLLNVLVSSGADSQLCVWNTNGWEKQTSKHLQIPVGRVAAPLVDTRVRFHQDQTHLLALVLAGLIAPKERRNGRLLFTGPVRLTKSIPWASTRNKRMPPYAGSLKRRIRIGELFQNATPVSAAVPISIPYMKNPMLDPLFRVYFSREWFDALHLSFRNFLTPKELIVENGTNDATKPKKITQKKLKLEKSNEVIGENGNSRAILKFDGVQKKQKGIKKNIQDQNKGEEKNIVNGNGDRSTAQCMEDNKSSKVDKNALNLVNHLPHPTICLPTGSELVTIAGVDLPKQDAGNALQFLEFCSTFGKLAFTGSTETGKIVLGLAAKSNLKLVTLELGGKYPFIVCEDANVDEAVELAHAALFYNQVDSEQFDKILKYIRFGVENGATLETGEVVKTKKGVHLFIGMGLTPAQLALDKNHRQLPHMLPSEKAFVAVVSDRTTNEAFDAVVSALGIENKDGVVVYDGKGIFSAGRVWWMFRVFGHDRVWVLDGGLPRWLASGFDVESSASGDAILKGWSGYISNKISATSCKTMMTRILGKLLFMVGILPTGGAKNGFSRS
ncbi:hypothetical protein L2E82_18284 [Cichorium intybus]|uniref:Uncharacterized protein n=1 Tax=Cichorium intybus TaxID=13427 RepID=A0ACB9FAJ1_CICIN|nr:hypothetical protein L2E82_18284 [Cichorium intybus]